MTAFIKFVATNHMNNTEMVIDLEKTIEGVQLANVQKSEIYNDVGPAIAKEYCDDMGYLTFNGCLYCTTNKEYCY